MDCIDSAVALPLTSHQRWFAAACRAHREDVARHNLERQDYGVYLPLLKIGKRFGKLGWREVIEPLFPRYVFVQFDPSKKSAAPIRSTKGVLGLVRFGSGEPAIVPDSAIAVLRARENSFGLHVDRTAILAKGDKVRLLDGPFNGLTASFEERDGDKRVVLLLDVIGRSNRLTVSRAWIQRVTA